MINVAVANTVKPGRSNVLPLSREHVFHRFQSARRARAARRLQRRVSRSRLIWPLQTTRAFVVQWP